MILYCNQRTIQNHIDPIPTLDAPKGYGLDDRFDRVRQQFEKFSMPCGLGDVKSCEKVKEIIFSAADNQYKEVLLITGKGLHSNTDSDAYVSKDLSKLKFSIPDFITSSKEFNKLISSIDVAEEKDGGEGAVIIKLKKSLYQSVFV